tara:strand:+ start:1094 stop:1462 length:369 start_codon:yes stop_codon:yes gene_type:complete
MKKRVIHAELSKASAEWLTYEVTIQNEKGEIEKTPAYGKDLQHALSRVVHDDRVKKVKPIVDKVPPGVWVVLWFIGIGGITGSTLNNTAALGDWAGIVYISGVVGLTVTVLSIRNWFKLRNK